MKVYVACGLTHVPRKDFDDYSSYVHDLAAALEAKGHTVTYALRDSDPQLATKPFKARARLCYLWDREMVEEAELIVADVSYPSLGVGIELQIAEAKGTPAVLAFQREDAHRAPPVNYNTPDDERHALQIGEGFVTLMALGLPNVINVIEYGTYSAGIDDISAAVR